MTSSHTVITLLSLYWCLRLPNPDGFLCLPRSAVGFFINDFRSLRVYICMCDMVFSRRFCKSDGFIDVRRYTYTFSAPFVIPIIHVI